MKNILFVSPLVLAFTAVSAQDNSTSMNAFTMPKGQAQLFLDDQLISEKHNVTRVWHHLRKHPANPLILKSGPEEALFLFGTVLREPDPAAGGEPIFRMWYYAAGKGITWVAYASSRDGLNWEKPELCSRKGSDLLRLDGSRANNVVFCPQGWRLIDFSGVIKDPNPKAKADECYKLIVSAQNLESKQKTYLLAVSPDGIRWTLQDTFTPGLPCQPDRACLVWDPFRKVYALYCRAKYAPSELTERGGPAYWGRAVALCTSMDFKNWSEPEFIMHAEMDDPDGTEIYGTATFPYEGQWVSLPQIHRSLPNLAYIDIAVAHSRDGKIWQRERELVLPRGGVGEWDRFNQSTSTRPVRVGDELWVYYSGRLYRHGEYKQSGPKDTGPYHIGIGLATLRLDGWCSLQSSFDGGEVITKPVILPEGELFINAKSDWGEIVVEFLQPDGDEIEGMRSTPVKADGVSLHVQWPNDNSLERLAGKPIRLRFTIKNGLLYSWKVE